MELRSALYAPVYATWGVPAVLTLAPGTFDIAAIDHSEGRAVGTPVLVEITEPHARVLAGDVADLGLTPEQLDDGRILLNGKSWRITSHRPKPSPYGELDGEIFLLLEQA